MSQCIFCAIARGEIKADFIEKSDKLMVFRDINPAAPDHLLVVPIEHIQSLTDLAGNALSGLLLDKCAEIGVKFGGDRGFRVIVNTGADGGQTIPHLHFHILSGRSMGWPPG